jgi:hypothetical protein
METIRIGKLGKGDSFRTKTGKKVYTIVDIVYSSKFDGYVRLLKGGWYVVNLSKEVVKV